MRIVLLDLTTYPEGRFVGQGRSNPGCPLQLANRTEDGGALCGRRGDVDKMLIHSARLTATEETNDSLRIRLALRAEPVLAQGNSLVRQRRPSDWPAHRNHAWKASPC